MNYEDFPILKNNEYSFLHEQYLSKPPQNRESLIQQICNEIIFYLNNCSFIKTSYNNKINQAIKLSHQTLTKHLNNLSSLFSIQTISTQNISTFNLFGHIKGLNKIISLTFNWLDTEGKEYYKALAKKNIKELINSTNEILSSMEDSNINFYKHM